MGFVVTHILYEYIQLNHEYTYLSYEYDWIAQWSFSLPQGRSDTSDVMYIDTWLARDPNYQVKLLTCHHFNSDFWTSAYETRNFVDIHSDTASFDFKTIKHPIDNSANNSYVYLHRWGTASGC